MIRARGPSIQTNVLVGLLITAVILGLLGGGALLFASLGFYDVAATRQHTQIIYSLLQMTKIASVRLRAQNLRSPDLSEPAMIDRGLALYRQDCASCHGAPGVAPADFAKGMTPAAPPLVQVAREWTPEEMYWATRSGIKMTGMPAWQFRLRDREIWDVVAFLRVLPGLSPADYCARVTGRACDRAARPLGVASPDSRDGGNASRGKIAVRQYGCDSCHRIPGIVGPDAMVGPPLDNMAQRFYIAGLLLNTPENMSLWIRRPQAIKPLTAMPDLGVSEQDARDIAAYLRTLE